MAARRQKKRKKAASKSPKRRSKRGLRTGWGTIRRFTLGLLLFVLLGGGLVFAVLFHQADVKVRAAFDAKRWTLPAHIYARPLELYLDRRLDAQKLIAELDWLGYRRLDKATTAGTYSGNRQQVTIATRGFRFADSVEPARRLTVLFEQDARGEDRVMALKADDSANVAIARLEPRPLGSVADSAHEDRHLLRLDEVPKALIDILLLTEDRSFYSHDGVALKAILRASFANLKAGGVVQGGSTITQQLVKNLLLTPERSWSRKFNEALMAVALDARYEKNEILEAYLNEIYLGQSGNRAIHGFGLASQFYFDRPLAELDLHEMALLVGMVRGPSYYSPRRHPKRAFARRNRVLNSVAELADLDPNVIARFREMDLGVTERHAGVSGHPAFREYVQRHLRNHFDSEDLKADGLDVFTTLDPLIQNAAERSLAAGLQMLEEEKQLPAGVLEGAVVVVSVDSGEVLAAVGGRKAGFDGFNRALDARRPIGSLIKPAVFLTALAESDRYTLATRIDDGPFQVRGPGDQIWKPGNYDGKSHGVVSLLETLSRSYNLASARLGLDVGLPDVVDTLNRLGVVDEIPQYPSLLLGALDLAPIEVAQMYQTLANGGFLAPLSAVSSVVDANGTALKMRPSGLSQTLDRAPVFLVNEALKEVMRTGTGKSIAARFDPALGIAGKTGTTDDFRDSWFAGFSGNYVTVIWVGRDDNEPTGLSGATGALKIFGEVMSELSLVGVSNTKPVEIETLRIDNATGLLADENCDDTRALPFIQGSEPRRWAPCSRSVAVTVRKPRQRNRGDRMRNWIERVLGGDGDGNDNPPRATQPRSLDDSNR